MPDDIKRTMTWENLFCQMRTIKVQISLHIHAVWSAPLLFDTLAGLCSWADWFDSYLVENPEDRFSRDEDQIILYQLFLDLYSFAKKS